MIANRHSVDRDRGEQRPVGHHVAGGLSLGPRVVGHLATADPPVPLALLASGDAGPPGWPIRAILSVTLVTSSSKPAAKAAPALAAFAELRSSRSNNSQQATRASSNRG